MIRQALVVMCSLASPALNAEIFRWIDADGRTHFSDRRPADSAVQRVVPDTGPTQGQSADGAEPPGDAPRLGPYAVFDILAPTTGAVLLQPIDTLEIHLRLEPPLLEGHRLDLLVDGRSVAVEPGSTRFQIEGIGFRTHRLQARIQDALGTSVAATPSHQLELRQSTPPGVLP
jgi:hypothetical protein